MVERQRAPAHQLVPHALVVEADLDEAPDEADPEGELADQGRQAGAEAERIPMVPHAAEAVNGGEPRARERAHVHAVPDVVLEVVDVHQGGLAQVVVRELEVADLGGDDRLGARRER